MQSVRVAVPATSANLGPGFDCLGLAIDRGMEIRATLGERDAFEGRGEARGLTVDRNLVFVAAEALYAEIGRKRPRLAIACDSRIPRARGLGSSAAAIAAGLVAADALAGARLSPEALLDLATRLEGHPDNVAPALRGGVVASVSSPRGVVACPIRLDPALEVRLALVVAIPPFELSTAKARAALPPSIPHQDATFNAGRVALLAAALTSGCFEALSVALEDRLHEPFRGPLIAGHGRVVAAARSAGALGVTISGSGPTLLAWCPKEAQGAVAGAMQDAWGAEAEVSPVSISAIGARVL